MPAALPISLVGDRLQFGNSFAVAFQRTLRIPDDGQTYPLPPGLGRLPARWIQGSKPAQLIVPLAAREALWIGFDAPAAEPHAVMLGLGTVNAVTGEAWTPELRSDPQNYLVCPPQLWLDGVKVSRDRVRQFISTPMGSGRSIEAQISGGEEGVMHLVAVPPRPGSIPDPAASSGGGGAELRQRSMNLGAGGQMRQRLYPDPHGRHVWDSAHATGVDVVLASPEEFSARTGETAPPSPIDARTYTEHGLPWFELYDEPPGDLAATESIQGVRPATDEADRAHDSVSIPDDQIVHLRKESHGQDPRVR